MDRHAGACAKLHASFKKKNLVPEGRGSSFATSQFAQCAICVGAYFPKMLQPLAAAGAAAFFEAFLAAFFGAAFLTAFFLATAMVFTSLQLPGYFGPRFV